jgi:hypothetical protein
MKRKLILATVGLVALGLGGLRVAFSPPARAQGTAADLAGIAKLHALDVVATVSGEPGDLAKLWTADAIRLHPGGPADVGQPAIRAADERSQARHPGGRILSYVPDIKDVRIAQGWAHEWGYFTAKYQDKPDGPVKTLRGNVLRVLQKQSDGPWKFARVMWSPGE